MPVTRTPIITNVEEFTAVDFADIWEIELLPLCYRPEIVETLEECINRWDDNHQVPQLSRPWTLSNPEFAPWYFSRTDYWCEEIDNRIAAAAKEGDPEAAAYSDIRFVLFAALNDELNISEATIAELTSIADMIERLFSPQREEPGWWAPIGACHFIAPWALALAKAWKPDGGWVLLRGRHHSTVYSPKLKLVFDPLLFSFESGPEILSFALSKKKRRLDEVQRS